MPGGEIWIKKHFNRYAKRRAKYYRFILAHIVQYSQPGEVLDIGAGTGLFVECANLWGIKCVGVEGSGEGIKISKKRYPAGQVKQHHLDDPLPFRGDTFQTVVINQVIQYLEPKLCKFVIKEALRVLKPEGAIIIYSPSKYGAKKYGLDADGIYFYSPHELKRLLETDGFNKLIDISSATRIFGQSFLARGLVQALYQLTRLDLLSSTADFIAYKT